MPFHTRTAALALALIAGGMSAAGEDSVRTPMMIPEAKLPQGFPAPGPVGEVITKTYPLTGSPGSGHPEATTAPS